MKPTKDAIDVGIVTTNPQPMLDFYLKSLGFTYDRQLDADIGAIHRLVFGRSYLKIVEAAAKTPGHQAGHITAGTGYRYLTLEVDDLEDTWSRLVADGVAVLEPLRADAHLGVSLAMVLDPDGNVVEILQRKPAPSVA